MGLGLFDRVELILREYFGLNPERAKGKRWD